MCFGGGDSGPNPNIRPAGYALENSHSQVTKTTEAAPQTKDPEPTLKAPEDKTPLVPSVSPGLNVKGM